MIKTQFISIKGIRIKLSTIKRYSAFETVNLSVRFGPSDCETFAFNTTNIRNATVDLLDQVLGTTMVH